MWKKILLLICFFLAINSISVFADKKIVYDIRISDSKIDVNLLMELQSEQPANVFQGEIAVPENTIVKRLFDSKGEIKGFDLHERVLSFKTNYSVKKNTEIISIEMQWPNPATEEFAPVFCPALSFSGINGYEVGVTVNVADSRILSFQTSAGFEAFYSEKQLKVNGRNAANIVLCYAKKGSGKGFDNFILFNSEENIEKADELFYIIPLLLGVQPIYEKFPVLVLEDEEFDEKINAYSQGINSPGGLSVIRKSLFETGNAIEVILHETTHAFNLLVFNWNNSKAAFFDEGIAKVIECIARKKLGKRCYNVFYKSLVYIEGPKMITLYPTGDWEELLAYYKNDKDFMNEWNPKEKFQQEFGYAYSELFLKNFIKEKGIKGLQEGYKKFLNVEETVDNGEEFTKKIADLLEIEEKPCYYLTENELKTCLDKVNGFTVELPKEIEIIVLGNLLYGEKETLKKINSKKIKEAEKKTFLKTEKEFEEKILKLIKRVFNILGKTIAFMQTS